MTWKLNPTLWRTARVLANEERLRVLRRIYMEAPRNVTEVGRRERISKSRASQILRALQSRGLIRPQRVGVWVCYTPEVNASVEQAGPLATALRKVLAISNPDYQAMLARLTAFTYPRRIAIVQAIANGAATRAEVAAACRLCPQVLGRHLAKLIRRGVVTEEKGRLALTSPIDPLSAALRALALESRAPLERSL